MVGNRDKKDRPEGGLWIRAGETGYLGDSWVAP